MFVRKADIEDLNRIMSIYHFAQRQMIENGNPTQWGYSYPTPDLIERIASDGAKHGIFKCAADYCKSICDNIRIDTHHDNVIMQKLIEKNDFKRCGTIYVADGSPRIAYQWSR